MTNTNRIQQVVKEGRGLRTWAHRKAAEGVEGPSRRKPASRFKGVDEDSANGADIHPVETLGEMELQLRGHQPKALLGQGGLPLPRIGCRIFLFLRALVSAIYTHLIRRKP